MKKQLEIVVEGVRLADAAPTAAHDAIKLFHRINGVVHLHSTIPLTTAQHNHLAAGHTVVVRDHHGNAFEIHAT